MAIHFFEKRMPPANDFAVLVAFSLLCVADLVGNLLVCMIILQRKRFRFRRSTLDFLFLNLATADLLVAIFAIPRYVLHKTFSHPLGITGDLLCRFVTGGNLMWTAGAASVFSLVTIAFERRRVISRPFCRLQSLSKPKLRGLVLMSWTFAVLLNLPLFFIMSFDEKTDFCIETWPSPILPKVYGILWFTVAGILPIVFMIILYSKVVYQLWIKKPEATSQPRRTVFLMPRIKATKLAITLTVIYAVCWLPNLILYILAFQVSNSVYASPLYKWSVVLTCLNSTVNPFVYSLQSRRFRSSVKRSLMCK
ncbi:pyroglutamylated RF-amide peptide receptor-like [Montipora foliosa]|uniref:pyroglutamylated RF-amide peptide receptor-like n=1 Tax=Montipora foliosa TaxID=591990 RepID=UPI0035F19D1F